MCNHRCALLNNRHRRQRETLAPRREVELAPACNGRGGALLMSLYRCRFLDPTFNVFRMEDHHLSLGERQVIVILTNPALIDWISPDRRRVEILQDDISTVSTNKIVATSAGH